MMCRMHLYREVHAAGDLLDPVWWGVGSYLQTPQNIGKRSSRAPNTSTKIIFTNKSATEKGTSLQQQAEDKDSGD